MIPSSIGGLLGGVGGGGEELYIELGVRIEYLSLLGILCILYLAYFEYYLYCWLSVGLLLCHSCLGDLYYWILPTTLQTVLNTLKILSFPASHAPAQLPLAFYI